METILEGIRDHWKRYLVSSLVTFLAGFFSVILANIEGITMESFTDGGIIGLLFLAVRSGIKLVLEIAVPYLMILVDKIKK